MRTEPYDPEFQYTFVKHPQGDMALSINELEIPFQLATNKLVDPMMADLSDANKLQIQLYNEQPGHWTITLFYRPDQAGQKIWTHELPVNTGWSEHSLIRNTFHSEEGTVIPFWDKAHRIMISFQGLSATEPYGSAAIGKILFN